MKVLVLGTRGFPDVQGGIEKHCEELYPRLSKLSCEIVVCTRTPYISKLKRVNLWRGIQMIHVWTLKQKYFEAIVHTFLGIIVGRLKSIRILHIHAVGPSLLIPFAKLLGMRVIFTHHGPDYKRKKWGLLAKTVLQLGEYFGIKFANQIIVVSKTAKEYLQRRYKKDNLVFIPNGVKMQSIISTYQALQQYNIEPGKYIFTACRFVPEKGLHDLIQAYGKFKNPDFKLVIAGDADHETEYSIHLKKDASGINGIVLTGFISGTALQELYTHAGLFVLPSYYEGLPIALLEALSYGLPVLVSNILPHQEFILPKERYFSAGNREQLAQKIKELFSKKMSDEEKTNQKIFLEENHDWDQIAKKVFSVYLEAVRN